MLVRHDGGDHTPDEWIEAKLSTIKAMIDQGLRCLDLGAFTIEDDLIYGISQVNEAFNYTGTLCLLSFCLAPCMKDPRFIILTAPTFPNNVSVVFHSLNHIHISWCVCRSFLNTFPIHCSPVSMMTPDNGRVLCWITWA